MGYYLNSAPDGKVLPARGKAEAILVGFAGARALRSVEVPRLFSAVPAGQALVCVVENGWMDAAGYCFDQRELEAFSLPEDRRRKTWILIPDEAKVQELTGFRRACPEPEVFP